MEAFFLKLVNMSITASWLVLAVIAVRFFFKKAPKWILCLLWGFVAFRLICPFSVESKLSLIPDSEPLSQEAVYAPETAKQAHGDILDSKGNLLVSRVPAASGEILDSDGNVIVAIEDGIRTYPEKELEYSWSFYFSKLWLLGFALMLAYTAASYYLLKRKVATAVPLKRGIKQSEYVDSPFVLGILRPVIYLPFDIAQGDMEYVIAHEQAHIRRRDHWWKPLGFLLLSIYWFNPVLWVAYILLCRDIEAACDEKVIRDMDKDGCRAYSKALLNCSVHRRRIAACPLAFGEVGVKGRVKGVMSYKKPAFWAILIALIVCMIVAVCFLTNPKDGLPVTVDVDYIGRNWADLKFILDDSYAEGQIQISDDYILEVQEQGMWREVENLSGKQPAEQVIDVQSDSADFDAWTSINWEEKYGRLPDGTFRLRKNVTIHKDSDNSETQPIYVEFTIGGSADDYVTYTLEDITPTGAKLYEHEKVDDEFQLIYDGSGGIWLESYRDEQWVYVEPTEYIEALLKKDRHYVHQLISSSDYIQLDWSSLYGELPDGTYRIAREVTNTTEDDLRVCTAYVEFTIDSVYTWFDRYSLNYDERHPKEPVIDLPGLEEVSVSYDNSENEIRLVTADDRETIISGDARIQNFYASLPANEIEIREVPDKDFDSYAEEVRNQMAANWEITRDIIWVDKPLANKFSVSGGKAWNSPQEDHYFVDNRKQGTFHIVARYYLEAAEGLGMRFASMIQTFEVVTNEDTTRYNGGDEDVLEAMRQQVAAVTEQNKAMVLSAQQDSLNQEDTKEIAEQRYQLWLDTMDSLWTALELKLDADTMHDLLVSQLEWSVWKASEQDIARAEVREESQSAAVFYGDGADMLEQRVYYLLNVLEGTAPVQKQDSSVQLSPEGIVSQFIEAYYSGDRDTIKAHLSESYPWDWGVDVYTDFVPADPQINAIKGLDNLIYDMADRGELHPSVEFRKTPDSDYYIYLSMSLAWEDNQWKVSFYALEG